MISRRGLLTGLTSLLAAPAIVRVSSLMPVKVMPGPEVLELQQRFDGLIQYRQEFIAAFEKGYQDLIMYGSSMTEITMRGDEVRFEVVKT